MRSRTHAIARKAIVLLLLGMGTSCGGDDPAGPDGTPGPDFMVGEWNAQVLVVTSTANPEISIDLIASGATFTLSVQPSGRYTAILSAAGQGSSESGTLSVEGTQVVFRRTLPSADVSRSAFVRNGDDVTLTGPTLFDFNLDGTSEDATIEIGLTPR